MSTTTLNGKTVDYYGTEMEERRKRFNSIINRIDMVLMNNIPEVDSSIWENWEQCSPMGVDECDIEQDSKDGEDDGLTWFKCNTHDKLTLDEYQCEDYEEDSEVYQWFAINDSDAKYLADHNQYVTYSDMLDSYFLAICHFGTSWDYVDSMVNDILGDR